MAIGCNEHDYTLVKGTVHNLRAMLGEEYAVLDRYAQELIAEDWMEVCDDPDEFLTSAFEYARRIGSGNLESYSQTLKAVAAMNGGM